MFGSANIISAHCILDIVRRTGGLANIHNSLKRNSLSENEDASLPLSTIQAVLVGCIYHLE